MPAMNAGFPEGRFLFAVCQIGAERALKNEVKRVHPELHSAFARPGLVTWKAIDKAVAPDFVLESVFARAYGAALGPAGTLDDMAALAEGAPREGRMRLHVW